MGHPSRVDFEDMLGQLVTGSTVESGESQITQKHLLPRPTEVEVER